MALSSWFDPNGARGVPSGPQFRYANSSAVYTAVYGVRNPATGQFEYDSRPIPNGTRVVPDWGRMYHGPHSFKPYDESHLVPMHLAFEAKSPGPSYKLAVRIPILVEGIEEVLMFMCSGPILQNAMKRLLTVFEYSPEAADGLLRVYILRASRQFTMNVQQPDGTTMAKLCTEPVWEPAEWMPRDVFIFGDRIVPPPSHQLAAMPAAPWLPQPPPPANGNAAPIPASDVADEQPLPGNDNIISVPQEPSPATQEPRPDPFANLAKVARSRPPF